MAGAWQAFYEPSITSVILAMTTTMTTVALTTMITFAISWSNKGDDLGGYSLICFPPQPSYVLYPLPFFLDISGACHIIAGSNE